MLPSEVSAAASPEAKLGAQRIDEYLSRLVPFGFSGSALVAEKGTVLLHRGYGLADDAAGTPNRASTVHSVGSVSKQFTGAAIMALEMDGKLTTEQTLADFWPEAPADKRDITLHQLLTHTAGIVEYSGGDYQASERDETVQAILAAPLRFAPGAEFGYSNSGYTLLAAVVELVSGQPFEEYLAARLFEPAGMRWTGYRLPEWSQAHLARAYAGGQDNGTNPERTYPSWHVMGNGEILSTTGDLLRWHEALSGDRVLSEGAKQKLYTPELNDYAYGWDVIETDFDLRISHDGGSDTGTGCELRRYVNSDRVLVLFTNRDSDALFFAGRIGDRMEALLFGQEVPLPPAIPQGAEVARGTAPETEGHTAIETGRYRLETGGTVEVRGTPGNLRLVADGADATVALLFSSGSDTEALMALAARSEAALRYLETGDFSAFERELTDPARRQRYRSYLDRNGAGFRQMFGDLAGVTASMVRPSARQAGEIEVVTKIEGARGAAQVSLFWLAGQLSAMGDARPAGPGLVLRLVPAGAEGWIAYDPVGGGGCALTRDTAGDPSGNSLRVGESGPRLTRVSGRPSAG